MTANRTVIRMRKVRFFREVFMVVKDGISTGQDLVTLSGFSPWGKTLPTGFPI
jgi:hypothetical protein